MARDSQAALVALNRFGFGARGGAAGDFVNAASDPRGFVKDELNRTHGALLEMPGLQPTSELAQAVFGYQLEIKQAREASLRSGAPMTGTAAPPSAAEAVMQRRKLALNNAATDLAEKPQRWRPARGQRQGGDGDAGSDAARTVETAAAAAQHHPEDFPG